MHTGHQQTTRCGRLQGPQAGLPGVPVVGIECQANARIGELQARLATRAWVRSVRLGFPARGEQ